MELIYRVKKPETIQRFIKENYIPTAILERDDKFYKIFVNQKIRSRKDTVRKGDRIHFHIKDEPIDPIKPQAEIPLDIIYEDNELLIVNKPSNQRMMVSKKYTEDTLANAIVHHYIENKIQSRLHFINRLDTDISGLVVLAKHKFIKFLLSEKLKNEPVFHFQAIVDGEVQQKEFSICLPIGKMEESNLREVSEDGKECETSYKVIKSYKTFSLLDIQVKNKLTHQIKVHLAYFSFPIVGDIYYNKSKYNVKHILLHNHKVKFIHPITDELMTITSEIPESFSQFLKK